MLRVMETFRAPDSPEVCRKGPLIGAGWSKQPTDFKWTQPCPAAKHTDPSSLGPAPA